jgi:flagellar P-ring protein precursor FlgI
MDRSPLLFARQLSAAMLALAVTLTVTGGTRIKDLVLIAGARDNQLVGYGLVTGLAEDGDKNPIYTLQAMANMLQWFGMTMPSTTLQSKDVAGVIVTANIPAFAKPGTRIDITVATLGDAKSLHGGVLVRTELRGVDGRVYALAQGPVSVGGFSAGTSGAGGASVQKNHPTVAQIVGGALVEREIPATIVNDNRIELLLREADFTSASRLAAAINQVFTNHAVAIDASTIRVQLPPGHEDAPVDFIARLEAIELTPDTPARIVINERTGTIVANSRIRIASCAISHANLTINIASTIDVSQPSAFSDSGTTVAAPRTETAANESVGRLIALPEMPTVEKVATALNSLGVTPRDMMSIFQAMKQAGALQAELVIH